MRGRARAGGRTRHLDQGASADGGAGDVRSVDGRAARWEPSARAGSQGVPIPAV